MKQLVEQVDLEGLDLFFEKKPRPADILERISRAKSQMRLADSLREHALTDLERLVAHLFPFYEKALRRANCFDFDDLLLFRVGALKAQPELFGNNKVTDRHNKVADYNNKVLDWHNKVADWSAFTEALQFLGHNRERQRTLFP